jgi:hypothetical protein
VSFLRAPASHTTLAARRGSSRFVALALASLLSLPPSLVGAQGAPSGSEPVLPAARPTTAPTAPPPAAAPAAAWGGVAVVALEGASDPAWSLAQAVYADASLRPAKLGDASARILAGEPAAAGAAQKLLELAELRAAIRGDDAGSRRLLSSLAHDLGVTLLLVVSRPSGQASRPQALVFSAASGRFEPPPLLPDLPPPAQQPSSAPPAASPTQPPAPLPAASTPAPPVAASAASAASAAARPPLILSPAASVSWTSALALLRARVPRPPPAAPTSPQPGSERSSSISSGWLWGALGAAAALGLGAYFLTRNTDAASTGGIPISARVAR